MLTLSDIYEIDFFFKGFWPNKACEKIYSVGKEK